MTLHPTDPQFFLIVIVVFGLIGIQRGWRREIISLAFILTGILFLDFGSLGLAQLVFINFPLAIQTLFTGSAASSQATTLSVTDPRVAMSTAITFVVFVSLGYLVSYRVGPKATKPGERFWGIIAAVIAGCAILYAFLKFTGNKGINFAFSPPAQNVVNNYLVGIFIIAIVIIIIALIANRKK